MATAEMMDDKDVRDDGRARAPRAVVGSQRQEEEIFGRAFDGRIFRRIWHFIRPYRRQMAIAVAAVLIFTATQVAIPLIIRFAIDHGMATGNSRVLPRVTFLVPDRQGLPGLDRYATLQIGTERRVSGYTEASRGCKHRCRHCPIVPVYDGRFRIVPIPVVLEDVRRQVAAGARHITFGDPDFLNGPRHARELVVSLAREFPGLTYDVTIKIEHLVANAGLLPVLRDTGCLFVTSAVESIDDRVLAHLEKGHTRRDFESVVERFRDAGLTLVPTFVPFTPWTTLAGYCELLTVIDSLDLVEHVAPVQLMIRLLIPEGSRLLELEEVRSVTGAYSPKSLTYPWTHRDPAVDALQRSVEAIVGRRLVADRQAVFGEVWETAFAAAKLTPPRRREQPLLSRAAIPYLNEPWYC